MVEDYLTVWRSFLKFEESLSRKNFWIFFGINCFGLAILGFITNCLENVTISKIFELFYYVYILGLISAGIRRMNDIKIAKFYFFIPLYNIYLCLLPSCESSTMSNQKPKGEENNFIENQNSRENRSSNFLSPKKFLKIVGISFLLGVISFFSILFYDLGYGFYIAMGVCGIVYPIIITIYILLLYAFKKDKIDKGYLSITFIIIGTLVLVLTNIMAYLATQ